MSNSAAENVLAKVNALGVDVSLTYNLNLRIRPANKLDKLHKDMVKNEKEKIVDYLAKRVVKEKQLTLELAIALARIYHEHHFHCGVCIAAGKGYGERCKEGSPLWFNSQLLAFL
jgi:hypothetical protein